MTRGVLYIVACAAPPVRTTRELVAALPEWTICVILTPTAAEWVDVDALAEQTGFPVRSAPRGPDDPRKLPPADLVLVAPATFNTVNKWAAGISDNHALGVLNEAIGLRLPVLVGPWVKPTLAAHPAFGASLAKLESWGVTLLPNEHDNPVDAVNRWSVGGR
ncbi:flavoprotein [Actinokineospora sp. NBRC 105648]|uniref:flavoprotein n=1 Tax=Actinokineospora sp. NBRC 105648 TaxID=3032206 RepID=UPI0024A1B2A7|nr:flavoprotein [Actinokineospora sp. NBRC 105648]GLZ42120.1 flavoprotein [Actinokineospora sp. NBRC 105648]